MDNVIKLEYSNGYSYVNLNQIEMITIKNREIKFITSNEVYIFNSTLFNSFPEFDDQFLYIENKIRKFFENA